jgi:putative endonuclease
MLRDREATVSQGARAMGAYFYVLRCNDGSYYVGTTVGSLEQRLAEHEAGAYNGYTAPNQGLATGKERGIDSRRLRLAATLVPSGISDAHDGGCLRDTGRTIAHHGCKLLIKKQKTVILRSA